MGFEYRLKFADPDWYTTNLPRIADQIRAAPHFKAELPRYEFRLKDETIENSWSYDLRIFLRDTCVEIEVSASTSTFYSDLRSILEWIRRQSPVEMIDDDGATVERS